jgi:hypothetical protein
MFVRPLFCLFLAVSALTAQSGLTLQQLQGILRSSKDQGLSDREVARYLKDQPLSFRLTDVIVEDFQGLGVGHRTLQALRLLQESSAGMSEALPVEIPAGPVQPPPPSEEEQKRIIAEARANALAYTDRLPDFVCLQITRRYVDPSGLEMDWLKYDEVKTRVSYVAGSENYEVVSVNNQVTTEKGLHDLGGASSTGEFGSLLRELFEQRTDARFTWARHSLLRGKAVYVFNLHVPKRRSRWRLSYEKTNVIVAGYAGLVYIDKESERVLRMDVHAIEIPRDFPLQDATTRLDYDYIDISGQSFLLPLKGRVAMRDGRILSRNDVEFRLYRKFSAEATISFDEIDEIQPLDEEAEDAPQP